jgi:hypothetical protein
MAGIVSNLRIVAGIALCALTVGMGVAQTPGEQVAEVRERTDTLGKGVKRTDAETQQVVRDLEELANTIRARYSSTEPEVYARLTARTCGALQAIDMPDGRRLYLAQKFAREALVKDAGISVDARCDLVRHVQQEVDAQGKTLTGDALADLRREQAALWLDAWKRLEASIDKNWDPEDVPELNVMPPAEAGLPGGVAPEQVSDPQLRARYVAAIEANRQKAARYKVQTTARKLQKRWVPEAERFLIRSYMNTPDRVDELRTLLTKHLTDADARSRILDAVKNKKMPEDLVLRNTTRPVNQD